MSHFKFHENRAVNKKAVIFDRFSLSVVVVVGCGRKTRAFGGRGANRERDKTPKIACRRNSFLEKNH